MAAPTCTLYTGSNSSSININDGTTYTILPGVKLGPSKVKTWSDYRGYDGNVAQYNVSTANPIEVSIPLFVQGTSASDLRSDLAALNTSIDGITAGTTHLVYDSTTYHLLTSPLIEWEEDDAFNLKFYTTVTLVLYRNTVTA